MSVHRYQSRKISAIKLANHRIFLTELQQNFNKKPVRIKNPHRPKRIILDKYCYSGSWTSLHSMPLLQVFPL